MPVVQKRNDTGLSTPTSRPDASADAVPAACARPLLQCARAGLRVCAHQERGTGKRNQTAQGCWREEERLMDEREKREKKRDDKRMEVHCLLMLWNSLCSIQCVMAASSSSSQSQLSCHCCTLPLQCMGQKQPTEGALVQFIDNVTIKNTHVKEGDCLSAIHRIVL